MNLANFLLVTGRTPAGEPDGVAPDLAREIGRRLGVPVTLLAYANPGDLVAAVADWDIGLVGADPLRAGEIAFTAAYAEIEATYLVPPGSPIGAIEEVDRPGVRIAVSEKSAYDMYLRRTLRAATLVHAPGIEASFQRFVAERLDALAGLRPRLVADPARGCPARGCCPGAPPRSSRRSAHRSRAVRLRPGCVSSSRRPNAGSYARG
ncbi:MAG: transporter substrate-binding domain-containing protein [Burkholderiales bacterium]|nr:transporter substrate-binding domain-containing protein [Burkholderiales bacterium]